MAKIARLKRYDSVEQALKVRSTACELAVRHMGGVDDPQRLNAYCVFFESYLASGPRWTERHMHLLDPPDPEPAQKTIVQLITRDD